MNQDSSPPPGNRLDKLLLFTERNPIGDRFLLKLTVLVAVTSLFFIGLAINKQYISQTPANGGTIVEGVIGTPRFVNPVLAVTRADQDMSALIYSGLLKLGPDGTLVEEVAEEITLQPDDRTYHIKLREDVVFHDGHPMTARDVAYTIALIQNPNLKSPLQGNWDNVLVEELSEYELNVVVDEPYAPFIENFTIGILPRHIWDALPIEQLPFSQYNTEPIGSGPFRITEVKRNTGGLINSYTLTAFSAALEPPKIDRLIMRFFQNAGELQLAFENQEIMNTASLPPTALGEIERFDAEIIQEPLPRLFSIFLNQNRSSALRDKRVRQALSLAIGRQELVDTVLNGYGIPSTSPVPPQLSKVESDSFASTTTTPNDPIALLKQAGWNQNSDDNWQKTIDQETITLSVTISTVNTPTFEATANAVADDWRALGVLVRIEQFEQADLLQGVIRPRNFEALLFGNDLSRSFDLYPFWHSSQKDDPGLNVAQYTNADVDALLETMRINSSSEERLVALKRTEEIIADEVPAIFLYVPTFTYVVSSDISLAPLTNIDRPHERFSNISDWHVETQNLWPIFNTED